MSNNMKLIMENWRMVVAENNGTASLEQNMAAELAGEIQLLSRQLGQQRKVEKEKSQKTQQPTQGNGNLNEVDPVTAGGIVLAAPALLSLIDKCVLLFRKKFTKNMNQNPTVFGKVSHWLHKQYLKVIMSALQTLIPELGYIEPENKKRMAELVMMIITIKLAIISGGEALEALKHAHIGHASFEGALSAVKSGEVLAYLTTQVQALAPAIAGAALKTAVAVA